MKSIILYDIAFFASVVPMEQCRPESVPLDGLWSISIEKDELVDLKLFSDCESDYDLPGPALHIDETPSPPFYNSTTTVDESCISSENVSLLFWPSSESALGQWTLSMYTKTWWTLALDANPGPWALTWL